MSAPRFVALLRGINVGGKNKLPMADLVAVFERAGCVDISTYIQSGNVIFRASKTLAKTLPAVIHAAIRDAFALDVPVIVRSAADIAALPTRNPFPDAVAAPKTLHVMFLADRPEAADVCGLDPNRSPPDAFVVDNTEVFLHCPDGLAKTKLSNAYFDRQLHTVSTGRNWNTVLKLIALASGD